MKEDHTKSDTNDKSVVKKLCNPGNVRHRGQPVMCVTEKKTDLHCVDPHSERADDLCSSSSTRRRQRR